MQHKARGLLQTWLRFYGFTSPQNIRRTKYPLKNRKMRIRSSSLCVCPWGSVDPTQLCVCPLVECRQERGAKDRYGSLNVALRHTWSPLPRLASLFLWLSVRGRPIWPRLFVSSLCLINKVIHDVWIWCVELPWTDGSGLPKQTNKSRSQRIMAWKKKQAFFPWGPGNWFGLIFPLTQLPPPLQMYREYLRY